MASKLLFASTNRGKVLEVQEIARRRGVAIIAPEDISEGLGPFPEVKESGDTYAENALLKARAYHLWSGYPVVADDTGLEVEALGGAPGVRSARFAGEGASAEQNTTLLLSRLDGVMNRSARFICELCFITGAEAVITARGEISGTISTERSGNGGFGYDSVFWLPDHGLTLAAAKEKRVQIVTHRESALLKLCASIESSL